MEIMQSRGEEGHGADRPPLSAMRGNRYHTEGCSEAHRKQASLGVLIFTQLWFSEVKGFAPGPQ